MAVDFTGWLWPFFQGILNVFVFVLIGAGFVTPLAFLLIRSWYRIPIIILRNTGGGNNNKGVTLHPKIRLWGRWVNTEYGQRMKVFMKKGTLPADFFDQDFAVPFRGGLSYFMYEKEPGQLFPVTFHNDGTLSTMNVSQVTPFIYNQKARQLRNFHQSKWSQYAPMIGIMFVVVAFIVGMVLYFNFVKESLADTLGAAPSVDEDSFAQKIADKMTGNEPPPGGNRIVTILPISWLLGWRKKNGI